MKREEKLPVENVRKKLNLIKPKKGRAKDGKFEFQEFETQKYLIFNWDGYGISRDKKMEYLIEVELSNVHTSHLQNHITRFLVMKQHYNPKLKIVFVIHKYNLKRTKEVIEPWFLMIKKLMNTEYVSLDDILYTDKEGNLLADYSYF